MRIVIVGDGKVGDTLTAYLSKEGYDIVVIDKNPMVIENAVNNYDVMGICGNGANYDVQLEAGVNKSDLLIAATSSDELNILCCMTAKKVGTKNTIARVRNPDYSRQLMIMQKELGLSMIVNPEYEAALEIARMLRSPSTITRDDFSKGRIELAEIRISNGSILVDKSLSSISRTYKTKILVCAVQREQNVFIPDGNFILKAEDKIYFTGSPHELDKFINLIGLNNKKIKSVLIVGGGKITFYLARLLDGIGMQIKIIEQDESRCLELSKNLSKIDIIHGDGSDQEALLEEGINRTDAFVALTDIDEENIVTSLYAVTLGIRKIITKVTRSSFINILSKIGLESIVSPKFIVANRIIRYVRAMNNAAGSSNVQTLYKIVNDQVEALEFEVNENDRFSGIAIKDLSIKSNLLIAGIVRNGKVIIPGGNDVIEKKDHVIVVTTNQFLKELNDILK